MTSHQKTLYIDALRGVAALNVFLFHGLLIFFPAAAHLDGSHQGALQQFFRNSPINIVANGNFAVSLFFVMSGYVLTRVYFDHGDASVLSRRAVGRYFRLALPAAASVGLVVLLQKFGAYRVEQFWAAAQMPPYNVGLPGANAAPDLAEALINAFGNTWTRLPVPAETYNQVLWTMPIEFWGSFLAFGLAPIVAPLRWRGLICVVVAGALMLWGGVWGECFAAFPLGVGLAARRGPQSCQAWWWLALAVGLYLGGRNEGLCYDWLNRLIPAIPGTNLWLAVNVLGAALVFASSLRLPQLQAALRTQPLLYLGRISFPFYLVHQSVLLTLGCGLATALLGAGIGLPIAAVVTMAAAFLVSAGLAHALMVWVDAPAIGLSRKLADWTLAKRPSAAEER